MSEAGHSSREGGERSLFERFLFAMIEGRHDEVRPLLAADVVWHMPPFAKAPPIEGRDPVLDFLATAPARFYEPGSMTIEPTILTVQDGNAACLARLRATTKHGAPYENTYGFFARLDDGRIAEVWELLDTVWMQEQMRARPRV